MLDLALYFLVAMASGVVFLPLHLLLGRGKRGSLLVRSIAISIAVSSAVGVAVGLWGLDGLFSSRSVALVAAVGGALTFAGFAGAYALVLPISVDRSLSAHVVGLVHSSPGGRLKRSELFRLYPHDAILGKRLRECRDAGIVEWTGDELVITPKGRRIARIYFALDRLMRTEAMIESLDPTVSSRGREA